MPASACLQMHVRGSIDERVASEAHVAEAERLVETMGALGAAGACPGLFWASFLNRPISPALRSGSVWLVTAARPHSHRGHALHKGEPPVPCSANESAEVLLEANDPAGHAFAAAELQVRPPPEPQPRRVAQWMRIQGVAQSMSPVAPTWTLLPWMAMARPTRSTARRSTRTLLPSGVSPASPAIYNLARFLPAVSQILAMPRPLTPPGSPKPRNLGGFASEVNTNNKSRVF